MKKMNYKTIGFFISSILLAQTGFSDCPTASAIQKSLHTINVARYITPTPGIPNSYVLKFNDTFNTPSTWTFVYRVKNVDSSTAALEKIMSGMESLSPYPYIGNEPLPDPALSRILVGSELWCGYSLPDSGYDYNIIAAGHLDS